jgi:EipB-like
MFHRLTQLSVLAFLAINPAVAADGLPLVPHRAAYELTLHSTRGKGVTTVSGRIGLEFTGNACEGYATNFRQVTEISDGEGKSRSSDMRLTTFEGGDGKLLRFNGEKRPSGPATADSRSISDSPSRQRWMWTALRFSRPITWCG